MKAKAGYRSLAAAGFDQRIAIIGVATRRPDPNPANTLPRDHALNAATSAQPVMKTRMSEPTVHSVARVSWVCAVKYAAKCRSRDTT